MTFAEESHTRETIRPAFSRDTVLVIGAIAALVAAIVFRRWLSAEFIALRSLGVFSAGPTSAPTTVNEWFDLLQSSPFVGLLLLNAFDFVNYALVGLIFFGVFTALRDSSKTAMTVSIVLAIAGISVYFASNHSFSLLALSRRYATLSSSAQQSILQAAGQGLLAASDQATFGNGPYWAFTLITVSGCVTSFSMLRGEVFSRTTAWFGIVANALGLVYCITLSFSPLLSAIAVAASAPFLLVWYILIAIRLLRLRRST